MAAIGVSKVGNEGASPQGGQLHACQPRGQRQAVIEIEIGSSPLSPGILGPEKMRHGQEDIDNNEKGA